MEDPCCHFIIVNTEYSTETERHQISTKFHISTAVRMALGWILRWWRLRQARLCAKACVGVEKSEIGDNDDDNGKDDPGEGAGSSTSSGSGRASSPDLSGSPAPGSGGVVPPNVEIISYGGKGPHITIITCSQH